MIEQISNYLNDLPLLIVGIVEYEDGTMAEVEPSKIVFVDGLHKEYDFKEDEQHAKCII